MFIRRRDARTLIADRDVWKARALENREKLDRELATQKARLERRHEAEMAEAERLNTLALRRADAWERRAREVEKAAGEWAQKAAREARDAAIDEAAVTIMALPSVPWFKTDALAAVSGLRLIPMPKAEPGDCCAEGHAEAGGTDD